MALVAVFLAISPSTIGTARKRREMVGRPSILTALSLPRRTQTSWSTAGPFAVWLSEWSRVVGWSQGSPDRYEDDHWLWRQGYAVGAQEPGGLLWFEQPNRGNDA